MLLSQRCDQGCDSVKKKMPARLETSLETLKSITDQTCWRRHCNVPLIHTGAVETEINVTHIILFRLG